MSIVHHAEGFAVCEMQLRPEFMNTGGRVHGGVLTSLADTAAGVAVRTIRPEGNNTGGTAGACEPMPDIT